LAIFDSFSCRFQELSSTSIIGSAKEVDALYLFEDEDGLKEKLQNDCLNSIQNLGELSQPSPISPAVVLATGVLPMVVSKRFPFQICRDKEKLLHSSSFRILFYKGKSSRNSWSCYYMIRRL